MEGFIELMKIFNLNYSILVKYKDISYSVRKGVLQNVDPKQELEENYDLVLSVVSFEDSNNTYFKELHYNK